MRFEHLVKRTKYQKELELLLAQRKELNSRIVAIKEKAEIEDGENLMKRLKSGGYN